MSAAGTILENLGEREIKVTGRMNLQSDCWVIWMLILASKCGLPRKMICYKSNVRKPLGGNTSEF
jgi:hypothetical protein